MADRLLLIENDAGELRSLGDSFERLGYEVVVIKLDAGDANGTDIFEQLRKENGAVILLTGAIERLLRHRAPADRRHQARSLSEVERQHIERTLRHHGGNRTRAALELGISRATLINKIKAYSLNL